MAAVPRERRKGGRPTQDTQKTLAFADLLIAFCRHIGSDSRSLSRIVFVIDC